MSYETSRRKLLKLAGGATAVGVAGCLGGGGGNFPSDEINVVIPWGPGGGTDVTARGILPYWEEELGVGLVVDNRPGASGIDGKNYFSGVEGDGYSLLIDGTVNFPMGEAFYDTQYTTDDFRPIGGGSGNYNGWFMKPGAWDDVDDFIEYANNSEDPIRIANPGFTSSTGLATYYYFTALGIDYTIITYDSGGEAVQATATPDVDIGVGVMAPSTVALIDEGLMELLFVGRPDQDNLVPEAQTLADLDLPDDIVKDLPYTPAFMVPEDTPDERVDVLVETLDTAMLQSGFEEWVEEQGQVLLQWGPDQISENIENLQPIVQEYADAVADQV